MLLFSLHPPISILWYTVILIGFGTYHFDRKIPHHVEYLAHIFLGLVPGLVVCFMAKIFLYSCNGNYGLPREGRTKRSVVVGLLLMIVSGIIFVKLSYAFSQDYPKLLAFTIGCNLNSIMFWIVFLRHARKQKYLVITNQLKYKMLSLFLMSIQFILLLYYWSLLRRQVYPPDTYEPTIVVCHFLYFIGYGMAFTDIVAILIRLTTLSEEGKHKEYQKELRERQFFMPQESNEDTIRRMATAVAKLEREANVEGRLESLDCEICGYTYCNDRPPLIMKNCGHTVCRNCIRAMQHRPRDRFACAICRVVTETFVCELPVNKALQDFITDRDRFDALACIDCNMRFSEERSPLVLKECGHTICDKCLEGVDSDFIICKTCRKVTFFEAAGNGKLLRNNAVIKVINELKRQ